MAAINHREITIRFHELKDHVFLLNKVGNFKTFFHDVAKIVFCHDGDGAALCWHVGDL